MRNSLYFSRGSWFHCQYHPAVTLLPPTSALPFPSGTRTGQIDTFRETAAKGRVTPALQSCPLEASQFFPFPYFTYQLVGSSLRSIVKLVIILNAHFFYLYNVYSFPVLLPNDSDSEILVSPSGEKEGRWIFGAAMGTAPKTSRKLKSLHSMQFVF